MAIGKNDQRFKKNSLPPNHFEEAAVAGAERPRITMIAIPMAMRPSEMSSA
jgi:hypothetical protein